MSTIPVELPEHLQSSVDGSAEQAGFASASEYIVAPVAAIFHKKRVGKDIAIVEGPPPAALGHPIGRLPRITRYMSLAIYDEDLIRKGHVHAYAEIATLGHVTCARVTQIMNLRLLAPDIQETLMSLERIVDGRDDVCHHRLQAIALESDWLKQR